MKVICIGNASYDITTPVESYPKENTKSRVHSRIECGGGPAGTAAYLLAKWGMQTYFAGIVGNDLYGERIRAEFEEVNCNIDYLQICEEHTTTTSYIIASAENGSRTVLGYRPSDMRMSIVNIDVEPDVILIDGQEPEISEEVIKNNPNAISIIDAGRDRKEIRDLCKMVNYVACSKDFAEQVSGIRITSQEDLEEVFKRLEGEFGNILIVTLEELGCAYRNDNGRVEIVPSVKGKAVDSTGAGDIFHGAFAYGIAKGWPLLKTLRWSNIAGAMSVTRIGGRNSIFTLDEMNEVYEELK